VNLIWDRRTDGKEGKILAVIILIAITKMRKMKIGET
jgi:hypothetical protein